MSESELVQLVANRMLETNSPGPNTEPGMARSQQQAIDDGIAQLPKISRGLDVNVKFDSVTGFEFTAELGVFDLCDIELRHGWVLDPQSEQAQYIGSKSYNELVELLIESRSTSPPAAPAPASSDAAAASQRAGGGDTGAAASAVTAFMDETASQLTHWGLVALHKHVRERELGVFFRNNHFSTIFRFGGSLYLLVTDEGCHDQPQVVWERLDEIDGDTDYLNADFKALGEEPPQAVSSGAATATGTVVGVIPAAPELAQGVHYPELAPTPTPVPQPAAAGVGVGAGTGVGVQVAQPQRHPSAVPSEAGAV